MLKNTSYNLLETITIVSKSLYRYDTYIHDAENSKSSRELWTTFKAQREKELSRKRIIDAPYRIKKSDR